MVAATWFAILPGCDKPDPIVTYTIRTKVPGQLLAGKDRMLAVMLPKGPDVWFFKVTGPESVMAEMSAISGSGSFQEQLRKVALQR